MKTAILTPCARSSPSTARGVARRVRVRVGGCLLLFAAPRRLRVMCTATSAPRRSYRPAGLVGRYPLANYAAGPVFPRDQRRAVRAAWMSPGVAPMIAYFVAQVIWLLTAFLANAVITLFAFAFNLDLSTGTAAPGSGALTPISARDPQPLRQHVRCAVAGRRGRARGVLGDVEGARAAPLHRDRRGARRVASVLRARDRDRHAARTDDRAARASSQTSSPPRCCRSPAKGNIGSEQQAKSAAEQPALPTARPEPLDRSRVRRDRALHHHHRGTTTVGRGPSAERRPGPGRAARRSSWKAAPKYTPRARRASTTATSTRRTSSPTNSSPRTQLRARSARTRRHRRPPQLRPRRRATAAYPLGPADKPAAEAMGKGGQYQRLLLAVVIFAGRSARSCCSARSRSG